MKYKLVISDFDNTLGMYSTIPDETVDTIKKFVNSGGKFAICTGRFYYHINDICAHYGLHGIMANLQGAEIRDIDSGKILLQGGIPNDVAVNVAKTLEEDGVVAVAYSGNKIYHKEDSPYLDFYKESRAKYEVWVDCLSEYIKKNNLLVQKFVVHVDGDNLLKTVKKYQKKLKGVLINSGGNTIMEIINPSFNKASAVKYMADYYNIPLSEVMTIGDSINDIDLVKGEWHGVAVGDAKEPLKKVAKEITLPFKEQPVKYLIEKYCL